MSQKTWNPLNRRYVNHCEITSSSNTSFSGMCSVFVAARYPSRRMSLVVLGTALGRGSEERSRPDEWQVSSGQRAFPLVLHRIRLDTTSEAAKSRQLFSSLPSQPLSSFPEQMTDRRPMSSNSLSVISGNAHSAPPLPSPFLSSDTEEISIPTCMSCKGGRAELVRPTTRAQRTARIAL